MALIFAFIILGLSFFLLYLGVDNLLSEKKDKLDPVSKHTTIVSGIAGIIVAIVLFIIYFR